MSFFQSQYNSVNTILKNRDIKIQEQTKFAFSLLQSRSKLVSHIQVHLLTDLKSIITFPSTQISNRYIFSFTITSLYRIGNQNCC